MRLGAEVRGPCSPPTQQLTLRRPFPPRCCEALSCAELRAQKIRSNVVDVRIAPAVSVDLSSMNNNIPLTLSRRDETKLQNARRLIDQVKLNLTLLKGPKGWTERQHIIFSTLTTAELLLSTVSVFHNVDLDIAKGLRAHLESGLKGLAGAATESKDSSDFST